ncbi:MAG: hydroxymethylbilane synthase [Pirellulales bacterium]|nr:hydroxymethylbilane synthase [Pirellulales bacterium]
MTKRVFRIGTRGSALAMWQANWVANALRARGHEIEVVRITTSGDQSQTSPLRGFGGVGVFVKELEQALASEKVDMAVHSLKDLPTERVDGLCLAAIPPRAAVEDVLITRSGEPLEELLPGAKVGTGSARRRAFLTHQRGDLRMQEIRGNVDTRLAKLTVGEYDAIILAAAGLERLGLTDRVTQRLSTEWMLPAVGQGALGIEARAEDAGVIEILGAIDHPATRKAVIAERTLLAELRAGCLAPVGAWARAGDDATHIALDAAVASTDGTKRIDVCEVGGAASPVELGRKAAGELLRKGAAEIIAAERNS